jgi:hypothetical protein
MPEDWHERNDPGFVPGGAGAMADRILATKLPLVQREDGSFFDPETGADVARTQGLPQGYGDPR